MDASVRINRSDVVRDLKLTDRWKIVSQAACLDLSEGDRDCPPYARRNEAELRRITYSVVECMQNARPSVSTDPVEAFGAAVCSWYEYGTSEVTPGRAGTVMLHDRAAQAVCLFQSYLMKNAAETAATASELEQETRELSPRSKTARDLQRLRERRGKPVRVDELECAKTRNLQSRLKKRGYTVKSVYLDNYEHLILE